MTDKKIKLTKEQKDGLKQQLSLKLARKEALELDLKKFERGAMVYVNWVEKAKKRLEGMHNRSFEHNDLSIRITKHDIEAQNYVATFKLLRREYEYFLVPEIQEICNALEMDTKGIEFKHIEEDASKLTKNRIYHQVERMPQNIELTEGLSFYKKHIALLKNFQDVMKKKWDRCKDDFELRQLEVDMFENELHILTLERRYQKRLKYHTEEFLPVYNADMAECSIYLDKYLDRAKEFVKLDPTYRLQNLLNQYEQHKSDDEKLWLFYTALRARIDDMINTMNENSAQYKEYLHLLQPIREKEQGKPQEHA